MLFPGLQGIKWESERCSNFSCMFFLPYYTRFLVFTNLDKLIYPFCSKIDQEREGEQIDRALLKNVLDIFVEIGMGQMDHYENDFEAAMLKDTSAYYSRKASNWILEDSCPDYMLKVLFVCGDYYTLDL